MKKPYDYFVILAEMRTGSNLLEENLSHFPSIKCHGEAFNPSFIGYPKKDDLFGVAVAQRDQAPDDLIHKIVEHTDGIGGFRFFHDHDPRAADIFLNDPRCAKIILSRNPLESYVSWKIAKKTDQWRLTNHNKRKTAQITFDAEEFSHILEQRTDFRKTVLHQLQVTGQTPFHISYPDLQNLDILNGMARFLGVDDPISELETKIKRQNPGHLSEKVDNFDEMEAALSNSDFFNLSEIPGYEPQRGANVPAYITATDANLLFMPVKGCSTVAITEWMGRLPAVTELQTGYSQKSLRAWKRNHPGHKSFTIVEHPVSRAHSVFCKHILTPGPDAYPEIRELLRVRFDLPIPVGAPSKGWTTDQHQKAFLAFLSFVKKNLAGKTAVRVDNSWASQTSLLEGISNFVFPDHILRGDQLSEGLGLLLLGTGQDCPAWPIGDTDTPVELAQIYDDQVEAAVKSCYGKDYMNFGFGPWKA
ncbi:hypothetical protein [Halocynthiibacter namhaensis]|uniref:hypothetical protein n=1 Tax=Halocynthiibacter namhaensis TaxID=1290553 RepID=UPI0005797549|nr:hypothetical protein [Halocynthiibacter namhaensis]